MSVLMTTRHCAAKHQSQNQSQKKKKEKDKEIGSIVGKTEP